MACLVRCDELHRPPGSVSIVPKNRWSLRITSLSPVSRVIPRLNTVIAISLLSVVTRSTSTSAGTPGAASPYRPLEFSDSLTCKRVVDLLAQWPEALTAIERSSGIPMLSLYPIPRQYVSSLINLSSPITQDAPHHVTALDIIIYGHTALNYPGNWIWHPAFSQKVS